MHFLARFNPPVVGPRRASLLAQMGRGGAWGPAGGELHGRAKAYRGLIGRLPRAYQRSLGADELGELVTKLREVRIRDTQHHLDMFVKLAGLTLQNEAERAVSRPPKGS